MKRPELLTGPGGGQIFFRADGSVAVTENIEGRTELPDPLPDSFQLGPPPAWGRFTAEMRTREEGMRGLPADHDNVPAEFRAAGIKDHKEATAKRMLEALHSGDAAYFDGLAEMLRRFDSMAGVPATKPVTDEVKAAIGAAARIAGKAPFQHEVFDLLDKSIMGGIAFDKFVKNHLNPMGFGWLPKRKAGRPKNPAK